MCAVVKRWAGRVLRFLFACPGVLAVLVPLIAIASSHGV